MSHLQKVDESLATGKYDLRSWCFGVPTKIRGIDRYSPLPITVIMSGARVVRMKITMLVAERTVIAPMLGPIIEALPVGSPMRSVEFAVNSGVRPVIACVLTHMRGRGCHR